MPTNQAFLSRSRLGANRLPNGDWEFVLWAPHHQTVSLHLCQEGELHAMQQDGRGYHQAVLTDLDSRAHYLFRLADGRELPDPASRFQPKGVHGPSQVVDTTAFQWTDQEWKGRDLAGSIFYELHVGTFTADGTFDALIPCLPRLVDLGITTLEIMPVAQFPGARNWGYDGTYPYAPQNSYGGPESLQRLVNAAHMHGLAVALDVVYNHLGPEGNYLNAFGPYFTDRYHTPWGQALNYDGPGSDEVRRFFIENALYWFEQYHFDVLRLDAVHSIFDFSATHFLAELASAARDLSARLGRKLHLIAESDLNDARLLRGPDHGGFGLDAQWSDDFHHSVHALLTKESRGYYSDFGGLAPLIKILQDGWFYQGQYSAYRKRSFGNSPSGLPYSKFVVCNQNHDQVGNRAFGERLAGLVSFNALKLAAGVTLLAPFVPLLFMGEEYGETAPFQYFTSHGDPKLVEAVRRGRREEFTDFGWHDEVPDPQDERTFARSHLNPLLKEKPPHQTLYDLYRELIRLRRDLGLAQASDHTVQKLSENAFLLEYALHSASLFVAFNFAESPSRLPLPVPLHGCSVLLDSGAACWNSDPRDSSQASVGKHEADTDQIPSRDLRLAGYSFVILQQARAAREAK